MDRGLFKRNLEGGYIEEYEVDLRASRVHLRVDVLDKGTMSSHDVDFERVSQFEFETESRRRGGDRLQLTELSVDAGPEQSKSEEWALTISIFDVSHIRIHCSTISIDGEAVR